MKRHILNRGSPQEALQKAGRLRDIVEQIFQSSLSRDRPQDAVGHLKYLLRAQETLNLTQEKIWTHWNLMVCYGLLKEKDNC